MGKLTYLIAHCTATKEGKDYSSDWIKQVHLAPKDNGNGTLHYMGKDYLLKELPNDYINGFHISKIRGRGWRQVGYADMVHLDGNLENLVPYNEDDFVDKWEITNGAKGINGIARHIVYVGGLDANGDAKDTRTSSQWITLQVEFREMVAKHPEILIGGHYDFANKACPSFNVQDFCKFIGIPEKNIIRK